MDTISGFIVLSVIGLLLGLAIMIVERDRDDRDGR